MSERCCPACGAGERDERGLKNGLRVGACRGCGTLYARGAGGDEADAACDYDAYYHEANLSVPDFIGARLDEIFASFAPYRRTGRLLDVGCGAGSLLEAARRAGVPDELHEAAFLHAKAYEQRRGAGRLPHR